jgi:hypothetical protein
MSDDLIRVSTEENEMTLEEMSSALPDTSTMMARIGESWWRLIYAARGGNWGLAGYSLRRTIKLSNTLMVLRPKHHERLERFQRNALPAVTAAVEAQDLAALEQAYTAATDMANRFHEESGYPYVRWVLPHSPPEGLELGLATQPVNGPHAGDGRSDGNGQPAGDGQTRVFRSP